jgi:hypothetical protein
VCLAFEATVRITTVLILPNLQFWHKGYRLHLSDTNLQLYNNSIADTFVFLRRPPAASGTEFTTSIALQKISQRVQKVWHTLSIVFLEQCSETPSSFSKLVVSTEHLSLP